MTMGLKRRIVLVIMGIVGIVALWLIIDRTHVIDTAPVEDSQITMKTKVIAPSSNRAESLDAIDYWGIIGIFNKVYPDGQITEISFKKGSDADYTVKGYDKRKDVMITIAAPSGTVMATDSQLKEYHPNEVLDINDLIVPDAAINTAYQYAGGKLVEWNLSNHNSVPYYMITVTTNGGKRVIAVNALTGEYKEEPIKH